MFGSQKVSKKEEKNAKEHDFFMFGFIMKIMKENQMHLKLIRNLCISKLFNIYIEELNK